MTPRQVEKMTNACTLKYQKTEVRTAGQVITVSEIYGQLQLFKIRIIKYDSLTPLSLYLPNRRRLAEIDDLIIAVSSCGVNIID